MNPFSMGWLALFSVLLAPTTSFAQEPLPEEMVRPEGVWKMTQRAALNISASYKDLSGDKTVRSDKIDLSSLKKISDYLELAGNFGIQLPNLFSLERIERWDYLMGFSLICQQGYCEATGFPNSVAMNIQSGRDGGTPLRTEMPLFRRLKPLKPLVHYLKAGENQKISRNCEVMLNKFVVFNFESSDSGTAELIYEVTLQSHDEFDICRFSFQSLKDSGAPIRAAGRSAFAELAYQVGLDILLEKGIFDIDHLGDFKSLSVGIPMDLTRDK